MTKPGSVKKTYQLKSSAIAALNGLQETTGENATAIVEAALIHYAEHKGLGNFVLKPVKK